ncbi:hypothetical protein ACIPWE_14155 [Streptomyces sp. NPDC090073]|uniref:hypothetical protein n=1 Tax=Streptomyces sp. NPDC090073 TaxID=3365936 RepID=UPI0037F86377
MINRAGFTGRPDNPLGHTARATGEEAVAAGRRRPRSLPGGAFVLGLLGGCR